MFMHSKKEASKVASACKIFSCKLKHLAYDVHQPEGARKQRTRTAV